MHVYDRRQKYSHWSGERKCRDSINAADLETVAHPDQPEHNHLRKRARIGAKPTQFRSDVSSQRHASSLILHQLTCKFSGI